jgi:hypothetical protein
MLTHEQQIVLDLLIQDHLGVNPDMMTVRDLVGAAAEDLPTGNTARLSRWIIRRAVAMPTPAMLERLVQAVDVQHELVEIRRFLDDVRAGTARWGPRGIDELWVPNRSWPFIDRHDLRLLVGQAALGNSAPALMLEGPTGFGKRTMCCYVDLVVRREGRFRTVVRHIQRDPDPGMLDSLVADLRIELGLDDEPMAAHEEPEREGVNRAAALATDAALAPHRVWFIANVVDPSGVEPEVMRFLDELLGRVQSSPETANNLRMVLVASDATLLGFSNLPGVNARHVLPEVTKASITEWLAAAAPGKPEALYELSTDKVLQDIERRRQANQLPASQRLEWLARQCRRVHEQLERVS